MLTRTRSLAWIAAATLAFVPGVAFAYMNPYDVLLSNELLLPSQPRETADRVDRQQSESAARRQAEQEAIFAEQHPAALEEEAAEGSGEDALHDAAPDLTLSDSPENREFLTLMRTLERISENQSQAKAEAEIRQQAFLLLQQEGVELHSGAPLLSGKGDGLAPTGLGTVAAVITMACGAAWTLRRAWKTERLTRTVS